MNLHKKIGVELFRLAYRLLCKSWFVKLRLVGRMYDFLYSCLVLPKGTVLVDIHGYKIYFDTGDKHGLTPLLFSGGVYDKYETRLFERVVGEGMTVVDLGANIGYYTLLAAKLVGERGKVFAFEPDPDNFTLLVKNIEINRYGNVVPVQKAVSNMTGSTQLFLAQRGFRINTIYDTHDGREAIVVEVTDLDTFFKDQQYPIDVIKMDIEGAEMAALQGMTKIISKNDKLRIMTEFWPEGLQSFGFSPIDFLNELVHYGFKLFIITNKEPWIRPASVTEIIETWQSKRFPNLFCQKSDLEAVGK